MRALSDAISTVPCLPGLLLLLPIGRPCLVRAKLIHNVAVRRPLLCADRKARNRCPIIGSPPPLRKVSPGRPRAGRIFTGKLSAAGDLSGERFYNEETFYGTGHKGKTRETYQARDYLYSRADFSWERHFNVTPSVNHSPGLCVIRLRASRNHVCCAPFLLLMASFFGRAGLKRF